MWGEFIARNNTELLNNLGNFVNRVSSELSGHRHDCALTGYPRQ